MVASSHSSNLLHRSFRSCPPPFPGCCISAELPAKKTGWCFKQLKMVNMFLVQTHCGPSTCQLVTVQGLAQLNETGTSCCEVRKSRAFWHREIWCNVGIKDNMSLHLMWGPFGSCRSFRLFERVLRQRPRHQRQHVIACDVGFFFPRRFFFRRFKTTAPVAAACWSSGLYKRRTTESLNPNYHVSSGSPSSQVKLDLEVAGKSVFLREKHIRHR